jgi:hypothetical protein
VKPEYQHQLLSITKEQGKAMDSFAFSIAATPYVGMGRAVNRMHHG